MSCIKRLFNRLSKQKPPEETPEERARLEQAANCIYEFFEDVSREHALAYIESFCPWVNYDELSEEDQKRFQKLSIYTIGQMTGQIVCAANPLETDEYKNLIPEPTPEQLQAYMTDLLGPETVAELDEMIKLLNEEDNPELEDCPFPDEITETEMS